MRYFRLSSRYRSPLNYSAEALSNAEAALTRLYTARRGIKPAAADDEGEDFRRRFSAAMNSGFSTPAALAVLFDVTRELNRLRSTDAGKASPLAGLLRELGAALGLLQADPDAYFKGSETSSDLDAEATEALIAQRTQAQKDREFSRADGIRDELAAEGVIMEDTADGTIWRRG